MCQTFLMNIRQHILGSFRCKIVIKWLKLAMNKKKELQDINNIPLQKSQRPHDNYYATIKLDFVQGMLDKDDKRKYPTISELAKKYKLNSTSLNSYANKNGWKLQRKQFQLKMEVVLETERIKEFSKKIVEFDKRCFDLSDSIVDKLSIQLKSAVVLSKNGEEKGIDTYAIESICRALEKAQKVGRLASGETTSNEKKENVITFSQGLNMISKNLESNPDLLNKLRDETIDSRCETINLEEDEDHIFSRVGIKKDDA